MQALAGMCGLRALSKQGRSSLPFSQLGSLVNQTTGFTLRITGRHHGLKETKKIRLVQAFIISRMTYSLQYLGVSNAKMNKIFSPERPTRLHYKFL